MKDPIARFLMHIVLFTHPGFQASQSMPRFANMLVDGMKERGHLVEVWTSQALFHRLNIPVIRKWLGYIDQFFVFPWVVRFRLLVRRRDALFVFADHALGPWVPLVYDRPHVIHCHDFLAQRSAQGRVPENPTGRTGRWYQAFIHRGYRSGRSFISVSRKTREDLEIFLDKPAGLSEVVYNGLNPVFVPRDRVAARLELAAATGLELGCGYLLHVGGNQWYKNRTGVVEIYNAWRLRSEASLPLLLIGPKASLVLRTACESSPFSSDIHLLSGLDDPLVRAAYAGAEVFLFPSLAEGFGWPIAEAMASGCPVITTGEAPMTEVGGDAALLIPRRPGSVADLVGWADAAADTVTKVIRLNSEDRRELMDRGLRNSARFNADAALDQIEAIYLKILTECGSDEPI